MGEGRRGDGKAEEELKQDRMEKEEEIGRREGREKEQANNRSGKKGTSKEEEIKEKIWRIGGLRKERRKEKRKEHMRRERKSM